MVAPLCRGHVTNAISATKGKAAHLAASFSNGWNSSSSPAGRSRRRNATDATFILLHQLRPLDWCDGMDSFDVCSALRESRDKFLFASDVLFTVPFDAQMGFYPKALF